MFGRRRRKSKGETGINGEMGEDRSRRYFFIVRILEKSSKAR